MTKEILTARLSQLENEFERCKAEANQLSGAIAITKEFLAKFDEPIEDTPKE
jgi:hypothetical protein